MQFVPICTFVDASFWSEVNRRKLNEWKLEESSKPVGASISIYDSIGTDSRLSLSNESFLGTAAVKGQFLLLNTVESFTKLDRKELMNAEAEGIWESIVSGRWMDHPASLNTFIFTLFADLKKFRYHYWNCMPVLLTDLSLIDQPVEIVDEESRALLSHLDQSQQSVFVYCNGVILPLTHLPSLQSDDYEIVVADPSTTPSVAGWLCRNVILAVLWTTKRNKVRLISLRGGQPSWRFNIGVSSPVSSRPSKVVGWERNEKNEQKPSSVDLSKQFHPHKLMEQAVDLNVSLIKWRLVPQLETTKFSQLKCLLLGAGTLGCNVARSLIGWGVRTITFVDNGIVSYSNPVRQSLSEFDDAQNGRKKADVAASALRRIFPSIDANAIDMTIPMPGHTVDENAVSSIDSSVSLLHSLIASHDAIFLLLDSREARWLPTLIASTIGKLCFSVALGFDNYVVIRHGVTVDGVIEKKEDVTSLRGLVNASQLGCYFCSDVTAPGNSMAERTLDQQCTVARPGLSQIASGLAVELLASVVQHSDPLRAPAWNGESIHTGEEETGLLGAAPHQIRGYVSRFNSMTPCVRRFEKCIACGPAMREAFRERGSSLVISACNSPRILEEISGLDLLQASVDDIQIDVSDDDF
ncbi:atg-7 [Pristionchus pacificus]|uniref:Ubiquitin-like modifier-activating enzyme ATG7 n=1 Tax=Pristionchus pacificus TaxID=54126 RepID=A0A4X3NSD3_PRIPA|nr:atg-7 [Pristionchus pacificus]